MNADTFHSIEQKAGPPDVQPVEPGEVDRWRRRTYVTFESFLRSHLQQLDQRRAELWRRDYSDTTAYQESIRDMRDQLKAMMGFWIAPKERPPLRVMDRQVVLDHEEFQAVRFAIEILPGLESYGIELIPKSPGMHPGLIAQHGWGGSPELVCGLTQGANAPDCSYRSLGLRAVRRGFHVVAMHHAYGYGTDNEEVYSIPDQAPGHTVGYGDNRLHRMALLAGGTSFGLALLTTSRGVDLLAQTPNVDSSQIVMYGLSQGGQTALYLPALDERIKASVSSAYFNERFVKLIGPGRLTCYLDWFAEGQFFPDSIRRFSDCDIVSLIAPRAFAVEAGKLDTAVDFALAKAEFVRAQLHYTKLAIPDRIQFIAHAEGHVAATRAAFDFLLRHCRS